MFEIRCSNRHHNELLDLKIVRCELPTIDQIYKRNGNDMCIVINVFIKWKARCFRGCLSHTKGYPYNSVSAKVRLVLGAIQLAKQHIDCPLFSRVPTDKRGSNNINYILDSNSRALPAPSLPAIT